MFWDNNIPASDVRECAQLLVTLYYKNIHQWNQLFLQITRSTEIRLFIELIQMATLKILWLGHETTVCTICLVFLLYQIYFMKRKGSTIGWETITSG